MKKGGLAGTGFAGQKNVAIGVPDKIAGKLQFGVWGAHWCLDFREERISPFISLYFIMVIYLIFNSDAFMLGKKHRSDLPLDFVVDGIIISKDTLLIKSIIWSL